MWVRLDDGFADHPKIVSAGPLAAIIQVRALCYCGRHLTDGFIPAGAVSGLLSGLDHISIASGGVPGLFEVGEEANEVQWREVMVEAGLWEEVREGNRLSANTRREIAREIIHDGDSRVIGFRIHDYLDYNPSKRDVMQLRRKKAQAGRAGGLAFARARAVARDEHAGTEEEGKYQAPVYDPSPPQPLKTKSKTTTLSGSPPDGAQLNGSSLTYARQILAFLNHKAGRNYQPTAVNLDFIRARLAEGATVDQCRAIIGRKAAAWKGDEKMAQFLRPATLFNRTKFAQYLGELPATAFQEAHNA